MPGQKVSAYFTLHVYFWNQRYRSRPVPCAVEPEFDEGFLLELHKETAGEEEQSDELLMNKLKEELSTVHLFHCTNENPNEWMAGDGYGHNSKPSED